jgi:hypothetical protein
MVIASNKAGSAVDRIVDGENGFLFESGNSNDLAEKLNSVFCMSVSDKDKLRGNARKTAEKWSYLHNINMLKFILST